MAGLTAAGFELKRLETILTEINDAMKAIFGENLNVDPESPDGQVNGVMAETFANLWELAQLVYDAYIPSNSTGVPLSELVQLNAILRKQELPSTVTLSVTGTNGTFIPLGSLASTDDGTVFSTDAEITIAGGVGSSASTATETGPLTAVAGTITNIDTPITGWDTVTNAADATVGQYVETDSELRARRIRSIETTATSVLESILAAVLEIEDVEDAKIFDNETDIVDPDGLDPHSFLVVVEGGDDTEIAQVIYNKKPLGIPTNGTTTEVIVDSQGYNHDIKFSRPTPIDIYVKVTLEPGLTYDGDLVVKQAIIDYADGVLIEGKGFGIADDVIYSEMFTPINQPSLGVASVTELLIDTVSPPTGEVTIDIEFDEKSSFELANITIVQV